MASRLFSTTEHHCEMVCGDEAHGANSNYTNCKTNPGHKNFLTVAEFGMEHLPTESRTTRNMNDIHNIIERTVKLTVSSTSIDRPNTFPGCPRPYPFIEHKGSNRVSRCGTGLVQPIDQSFQSGPCPCLDCKKASHPRMGYWEFTVSTATHVVFDDIEAKSVVAEAFYDTEDKYGVKCLYGVRVKGTQEVRYQTDACDMVCVSHEADIKDRLNTSLDYRWDSGLGHVKFGLMISHPHGSSKKISLGKFYDKRYVTGPNAQTIELKKGTHVSIPPGHEEQKQRTGRCEGGCVRDNPLFNFNDPPTYPHNTPTAHANGEEDQEMSIVNAEGNKIPKAEYNLYDLLTPTAETFYFRLNDDMEAILPPNSEIISSRVHVLCGSFLNSWRTFPNDTKFVSTNGDVLEVPKGTEFSMYVPGSTSYVTYDMPTCPGSSGAAVWVAFPVYTIWRHFGTSGIGGENRSGLFNT